MSTDDRARSGRTAESSRRAGAADAGRPRLPDLIRQREEIARDVTRIEAAIARDGEDSSGLYEHLLRYRRISAKLANRIELVRLERKRQTGA
jgi:hypothetical protein